ncbi:DUF6385 domain-containing protein [Microlunatus soli]|uniref:DUF6385 domain-containing protein n=1 Tax=Microlunatus soli TaxID=630515 RepID=A0A1H1ZCR2_9ACTN|nr:DUF6385 domain-containing protein [Microlunatus soli]SDT31504.1 hypothetical protein SAMN04489812_5138 [Microlunatus soli]
MRESHTAILERRNALDHDHLTEPFECAWASEATFYVYPTGPGPAVRLRAECSADGQRWVPHGADTEVAADGSGARLPLSHFDGWLRLRLSRSDDSATTVAYDVYLTLKE